MSWAARRQTTRLEDEAYCLLGIFDVHIPLLYGEGARAFRRLQEEIIKVSDDQSILAFTKLERMDIENELLAVSPSSFRDTTATLVPPALWSSKGIFPIVPMGSKYLELGMWICPCDVREYYKYAKHNDKSSEINLGILACGTATDLLARPAILLELAEETSRTFHRVKSNVLLTVSPRSQASVQRLQLRSCESRTSDTYQ
jgi:hypothetical protein